MAKKDIQDINELRNTEVSEDARLLREELISAYDAIEGNIKNIGDKVAEHEREDWKQKSMVHLKRDILGIANIGLYNKEGAHRLEVKNAVLISRIRADLQAQVEKLKAAVGSTVSSQEKAEEAKAHIATCIGGLKGIIFSGTNHINHVKRRKSYRRSWGAFSASLLGLGLMELWGKHKANTLSKVRLAGYVTNALYISLGVTAATLFCKHKQELKCALQGASRRR